MPSRPVDNEISVNDYNVSFLCQIIKWLNEDAEDYLSYKEYGDSAGSTQVLLDEHAKFEEAVKVPV